MISLAKSLLKYNNPVLISEGTEGQSPSKEQPQAPDKYRPPTGVLHNIFKPRQWMSENQQWMQQVSNAPGTREDILLLEQELNLELHRREAKPTGLCPIRRELYIQCFDELIRQDAINCAERGLLMSRVKNEIQMTFAAYESLVISKLTFDMEKALQAEADRSDLENRIAEQERDKRDLMKQVEEQKASCSETEKREIDKAQTEEKKHMKEVQALNDVIQQYKAQLQEMEPQD